jgi:hypothetical protein
VIRFANYFLHYFQYFQAYYRSGTIHNGEWVYSTNACKEEFFGKFPNDDIVEANLIPHIRSIVNRFVATGSVEKGKSVGRPPVNEEIVEDLRQRMNKAQKNPSGSYNFTCQKTVRKK